MDISVGVKTNVTEKWRPDKADVFIVERAYELLLQGPIISAPSGSVDDHILRHFKLRVNNI